MDEKDIRKKLTGLPIPEPSEDARKRALAAAMREFEEQKKSFKGSADEARPTGKSSSKGEPVMTTIKWTRPAWTFAAILLVCGFIAALVIPSFLGLRSTAMRYVEPEVATQLPATPQPTPDAPTRYDAAQADTAAQPPAGLSAMDETAVALPEPSESEESVGTAVSPSAMSAAPQPLMEMRSAKLARGSGEIGMLPMAPPPMLAMDHDPNILNEYAGRDRFEHTDVNPVRVTSEEPVSTFSIDVDTASYSFVRRALNEGFLPQKDAVRVEEMINYFDYAYAVPSDRSRPFRPTVAVYPTPWNPATRLLHIGVKGHEALGPQPRSNLVFLLDVSGSMSSPDKLPLLQQSLRMLVDEALQPEDTVAIAVYAGAAGVVLEPTKVADKGRIIAALDNLSAGGSTAGGEGIRLAYALAEQHFDPKAVNRVILATDGDFNVGIANDAELKGFVERERAKGIYLSVLGFGRGNYQDALMQALAQNGNGNAAYIDTLSEARKVLVDEASSTLYSIAGDVKVQVEFNPARVAEYRLIGYETRILNREDFNNDAVDAGEIGAGHTVTAIYEITPVGSSARLVDDLRYGSDRAAAPAPAEPAGEWAFVKIRYKLPGEQTSRLIERPVTRADEYATVDAAPADMRFAASVAAFGQILRGAPYTGGFGFDGVLALATPARGDDPYGYRSEFLSLVRLAKSARSISNR